MCNVIVTEWMSLDGVVQAPGAADEDTTGGFAHGGWHLPYFEDLSQKWVVETLTAAGGFLLPHPARRPGRLSTGPARRNCNGAFSGPSPWVPALDGTPMSVNRTILSPCLPSKPGPQPNPPR